MVCALLDVPLPVGDHPEGIKTSEPPIFPERPDCGLAMVGSSIFAVNQE